MRYTTGLLLLAAAPLPGVLLALADLQLGLRGNAVMIFGALCLATAVALGVIAAIGFMASRLQRAPIAARLSVRVER
jgi:hypothetical protein